MVDLDTVPDNELPPPEPVPPVEETDDEDYEYVFWGCMNAFYVALILWFFYIVFLIICRRLDKKAHMLTPKTHAH
jgi:hypothetical protein